TTPREGSHLNIIIVGNGKVGYTLAQYLSKDGHDVTVMDVSQQALLRASETLDVMCVRGNGANVKVLIEAGVENADVIVAVTGNDEQNMVCCLAAKQLGAKYSIARIRDPEYTESLTLLQKKLDIDMVINPERATAQEISRLLRFPFAINIESFAHGRVEMVEFRAENTDPILNMPLSRLHNRFPHIQFTAVQRNGTAFIPDGASVLLPGDRVYATGDRESVTKFFKHLGKDTQRLKSALLIGGGHIAYYLAKIIAGMGVYMRLIEIDEKKCLRLSEQLDNVMVICADGTDQEVLESENVADCGALICLTDRDEENLITGLYGARRGVRKVIVKVNRTNAMDVMGDLGIDCAVSPKLTTANVILRSVRALNNSRNSVVEKVYYMLGGSVEAYEFTALEGAPYLNIPLNQLKIRKGILVSVLVRDRKSIIPFGSDHIEAGDTVILTARAGTVVNLEDAFDIEGLKK
ncbi:MAG: Trk system potassium transporter TrkA, partial [Clostridia bacterium]|nr:Trk system potassium transporter TrkA [Clostridia bacterium]